MHSDVDPALRSPTSYEQQLLDDAIVALRYAAEHGTKQLDPTVAREIEEAQKAALDGNWSPFICGQLWSNFNEICIAIRPVTIGSIKAMRPDKPARAPAFLFRTRFVSDADIISRNYIVGLVALILVILPLQLYAWFGNNLFKIGDEIVAQMNTEISQFNSTYEKKVDEDTLLSTQERYTLNSVNREEIRLRDIANTITLISPFSPRKGWTIESPAATPIEHVLYSEYVIAYFNEVRSYLSLYIGIVTSFILPIMFGLLGATAYVVRHILRQIGAGSYVPTSRPRNLVRQALGVLVGAVVGLFSDLSAKFSLPPLAIAFLAGYGIDSIFFMFDILIEKFRPNPSNDSALSDKQ